ncbi:putative oxalocrotonate tautomerase enzyme-domain-containing protein [Mycena maculata]|uniref:Oxalocrotonate tautomerase enzyme-domain-containing protein n=1 Tax=Mycena maculata TaxID=230809 RepID=A0AAD7ILW6_9AGAR|nr:putative oxalocrotonate tautomerase enzyme-domain-containing protein [Mycena maculata]
MPLHHIFVPKGLYLPKDKTALTDAITGLYTAPPAFYVVVLFIDLEPGNIFVGGKTTERMVCIGVEHIVRNFSDDARKRNFMGHYEKVFGPFTKGRGSDWEIQVTDCDVSIRLAEIVCWVLMAVMAEAALESKQDGSTRVEFRRGRNTEAGEQSHTAHGDGVFVGTALIYGSLLLCIFFPTRFPYQSKGKETEAIATDSASRAHCVTRRRPRGKNGI